MCIHYMIVYIMFSISNVIYHVSLERMEVVSSLHVDNDLSIRSKIIPLKCAAELLAVETNPR